MKRITKINDNEYISKEVEHTTSLTGTIIELIINLLFSIINLFLEYWILNFLLNLNNIILNDMYDVITVPNIIPYIPINLDNMMLITIFKTLIIKLFLNGVKVSPFA